MAIFREGADYPKLEVRTDGGPDLVLVFGFIDYEEAAVSIQVEGVDLPIVLERDLLVTAIIQGWGGQFDDVHADETPESELGGGSNGHSE